MRQNKYESLQEWAIKFKFESSDVVARTDHRTKQIIVNTYHLPELLQTKRLDEIIGHELAHALLPPEAAHKGAWRRLARLLTGRANRKFTT